MQVIEELDNGKKGTSEASRNARQVSRFINELIEAQGTDKIASGLVLERPNGLQLRGAQSIGRLRFQFGALETRKRGGDKADNDIIDSILALQKAEPGAPVRSEEHTSELQSLMRISYAVFCLKKKTKKTNT